MMAVGEYRFGIDTAAYQSLERTTAYNWQMLDRVGVAPAQQFIGPGEDRVQLEGVIYPHFRGGMGQLEQMRAEAAKGEPLLVVDGTGRVWGWFCLTEVRETRRTFFSNGQARRIDFALSLSAYGGWSAYDS